MQILFSYSRYIDRFFLGCVLFVARCNIIRALWKIKKERLSYRKKYIENLCKGDHFFYYTPSSLCHFFLLSSSTPSPFLSDVLGEWPLLRYIILLWMVFYVIISWVNGGKYENLLEFNTSWLASLRTWYYFRLCISFSCSGYDLILILKSHTLNCYSFLQKFLLKTKTCKLAVGNCGSSNYC